MINTIIKNNSSLWKEAISNSDGTISSYGSVAETFILIEVFRQKGIDITLEEAQNPKELNTIDTIRILTNYPRIAEEWLDESGRTCNEADIEEMFNNFISLQLSVIKEHAIAISELTEKLNVFQSPAYEARTITGYN